MSELSVVGKSVPRIDALEKVTGKAVYCTDIQVRGMLHTKVLRSPLPHARILNIDLLQAAKLPGVKGVVTGEDLPQRFGLLVQDRYILAKDRVRFVGEPVVAVAAETTDAAAEALELIKVDYEEFPAIFDAEEAMSTDPPVILHPELSEYERGQLMGGPRFDPERPNIFHQYKIRKGNTEEGFAEADLVLENRFSTARIQHAAMEPHVAVAWPEAGGGLTMWVGRQNIWRLRADIGKLFQIEPARIRIIQPYVGGGFGGKVVTGEELIIALLALKTGKPVRLSLTREEIFLAGGNRTPMIIDIKDGVKKDGSLLAREIKSILKGGAYESNVGILVKNCSFCNFATYRLPHFKWDSYGVYVNEPPACSFRGFGNTQVVWAIESHMDMLAEKLGIDPVEFRRRNIMQEGESNVVGELIHSTGARPCLDKMVTLKGQSEPSDEGTQGPWRRGNGLAICNKHSLAPTTAVARVQLTEDEQIVVYHGADELGQGCNTVVAQIAAEEFRIPAEKAKVIFTDSLHTPSFDGGSTSSRVTYNLGNAVRLACKDAKKKLFQIAGERLEASPEDLETSDGTIYVKGSHSSHIRIAELFIGYQGNQPGGYGSNTRGGEIIGSATWIQNHAPQDPDTGQIDPALAKLGKGVNSSYSYLASGVEVAVNVETGEVRVLWCGGSADMGQPINPKMCEQQLEGGMIMGMGDSLYEEMLLDKGKVLNPNFHDYRIPSTKEVPLMHDVHATIEAVAHRDGPFGAKGGFGEAAMMGIQAAIGNAVYNAVGVRIKDLPISPEKVLKALKEKGESGIESGWRVDPEKCTCCGDCVVICPVEALRMKKGAVFIVDPLHCCRESCRICEYQCPTGAITAY